MMQRKYLQQIYISKTIGILFVIVLFCISVAIRSPITGRSFGDQHEWATAHTLIALEILQSEGAIRNAFRNIQTYPGENNKEIKWVTTRIMDTQGISYYTSYPPFALILAYSIFNTLSIPFTIRSIEMLNMILHGISAVALYLLLYEMLNSKGKQLYALVGVAYYLFLPLHLWFFHKVYSWDIVWHYFWVAELYIAYTLFKTFDAHKDQKSLKHIYLLGILNFITIFTEYQGVYFSIGLCVFAYAKSQRDKRYIAVISAIGVSTILSLALTFLQHVTISGLLPFLQVVYHKLFVQYGTLSAFSRASELSNIVTHLSTYFLHLLVLSVVLLCLVYVNRRTFVWYEHKINRSFILILFTSVVLHLLLFLPDHIEHEFTLLKLSIIISIVLPFLLSRFDSFFAPHNTSYRIITFLLVTQSIIASVGIYYREYARQPNQNRYKVLGGQVRDLLSESEVGFINERKCLNPQLIYFTKRNLAYAKSASRAAEWLARHKRNNGKLFIATGNCRLKAWSRIN